MQDHKATPDAKVVKQDLPHPIVGKSPFVSDILETIETLSKTRKDVILVGEIGVGRSAIARNIHHLSAAHSGVNEPLTMINVPSKDDKELEVFLVDLLKEVSASEPVRKTILLEDVEDLSYRNQIKLLSAANKRAGTHDVRFILTMKLAPQTLVAKRKLLDDLWSAMIKAEVVDVAPLRDRREDIPVLIRHFANQLTDELGLNELTIDINAIELLSKQDWRENIREVKAMVDKSVLFSKDGLFSLPSEFFDEKSEVTRMLNNIVTGQEFILDNSLDVIEKGILERALEKFGFNQSRAAQFLGMTEQTFRYKLKRLGISTARARG